MVRKDTSELARPEEKKIEAKLPTVLLDGRRSAYSRSSKASVAKWKHGRYHTDGQTTSWLNVRNPDYSQMEGRHDVFAPRRSVWSRSRSARPVLCPELTARRT
jgi:hypothetical protein